MGSLMLGVSGCRGVIGETLTPEVAARFAGVFAGVLGERSGGRPVTVVIGRDGRRGSETAQQAAMAGLTGAGCRVVDLGVAMTPTVATVTDAHARADGYVAGMVITASHNPQSWIGLKCLLAEGADGFGSAACAPPVKVADEIVARFRASRVGLVPWDRVGTRVAEADAAREHVDRVMEALEACGLTADATTLGVGMRVGLDSVNASGVEGGRLLLEALGCEEILHLGMEGSGVFPHAPEPTAENLATPGGLCEAVREGEMHVGFAQDPDADRLAIVDERGVYVGEEYTLALSALALLKAERRRGETTNGMTLVTNLSTSRMLEDVAGSFGARVLRTAVGEANVVEAMKREGALLGGEGNGGTIWPRVAYVRDSLSAMALAMWLISPAGAEGRGIARLSELVAKMPAYAIHKRKVSLGRREDADPAVEKIKAHFRGERIDTQDGVRVDFATGSLAGKAWLHVRASNTEPIMRLIAEAPTAAEAEGILDLAGRVIGGR